MECDYASIEVLSPAKQCHCVFRNGHASRQSKALRGLDPYPFQHRPEFCLLREKRVS